MKSKTSTEKWIREVISQHDHLRGVVADLKKFLTESRPALGKKGSHSWASDLARRMTTLHDELFRHFRFEEEAGVLDELSVIHPEAATKLDDVVGEHPLMLGEIRQLVSDILAYSEGLKPEDPQLRRRVIKLLDALHEHEREETALIQRLEYRDVAAAD